MPKNKKKIIFIVFLLIIIGGTAFFLHDKKKAELPSEEFFIESQSENEVIVESENQPISEKKSTEMIIIVDVKGAVVKPGIYTSREGERVHDLIQKAGGVEKNANMKVINLAQRVEDQMVIYIPVIGEETNSSIVTTAQITSNDEDKPTDKVNLNLADETTLQTLPGIGPSKAAAIMEYRTQNGSFKTVEDLKNISGIGDKTFEKLKEVITVE
jgi:competence protein ComEA